MLKCASPSIVPPFPGVEGEVYPNLKIQMKSWGKFCCPQNILGASQQNGVEAFSLHGGVHCSCPAKTVSTHHLWSWSYTILPCVECINKVFFRHIWEHRASGYFEYAGQALYKLFFCKSTSTAVVWVNLSLKPLVRHVLLGIAGITGCGQDVGGLSLCIIEMTCWA